MKIGHTVRAIRESLLVIQTSADQVNLESGRWYAKVKKEVERIDALVTRLDLELTCPMEKDCPRLEGKHNG